MNNKVSEYFPFLSDSTADINCKHNLIKFYIERNSYIKFRCISKTFQSIIKSIMLYLKKLLNMYSEFNFESYGLPWLYQMKASYSAAVINLSWWRVNQLINDTMSCDGLIRSCCVIIPTHISTLVSDWRDVWAENNPFKLVSLQF